MKTYEAVFNEESNKGVYGISLVYDPAMEGHFLTLSKQEEIQLKAIDEEKRILLGLVLEPDKLIYRNQGGQEFNVVFNKDTVLKLAHNFLKSGYQGNSSIEHSGKVDGVTFVESWVVENTKLDKSVNFGLSYPNGSWLVMMKVDSDEVWNNYVKNGKVRGFSVDALVELKEVNNLEMSDNKQTIKKVMEDVLVSFGFKEKPTEEIKLGEVKSEDGSVTYMYDGDVLDVGKVMYAVSEDGSRVDLPAGEYKLEDGNVAVLEDGGSLKELRPMQAEQPQEQPAEMSEGVDSEVKAPAPDEKGGLSQADEDFMNVIKSILIKYSEKEKEVRSLELSENNNKIDNLRTELESVKKELLELKEEPAVSVKKSQPSQVEATTKRSRILKGLNK